MDIHTIFGNDYSEFSEQDPFNPNTLSGYISRKSNEYYGALVITKVNGSDIKPQLIMGSPKMHYPFDAMQDGSRRYKFPMANAVEIYEKLDGTNVLAYFYHDSIGKEYLTFKTRLRPFLSSGRFGDFLSMWKEVTREDYEEIRATMRSCGCNLSFELYGNRNTHLIVYRNALDYALLFGVTNSGRILSPTQLITNLPTVPMYGNISHDFVSEYENIQKKLNSELQKVDDYYSGMEGTVWYLFQAGEHTTQIKCKPEIIELIHFAAGAGLGRNTIIATCWNAFENVDKLTVGYVSQLLLEEFDAYIVEVNKDLIVKCIEFVTAEAEFRKRVESDYKETGLNIALDKVPVMRTMSKIYPKDKMGKVYSIISNL